MQPFKSNTLKQHPGATRLMLFSLLLFLVMLLNVLFDGPILRLDEWVSQHVPALQSEALTKVIVFITDLNGVVGTAIFSLFMVIFLFSKKYYTELKFYLLSFLGASALFTIIKLLVERLRPALKIVDEQGLSFPSGHSTMAMAIALSLYVIWVSKIHSAFGRGLLLTFTIVWPLLIVGTRLYLNVHWLSDTLAGLALGIFWVTLLTVLFPLPREK